MVKAALANSSLGAEQLPRERKSVERCDYDHSDQGDGYILCDVHLSSFRRAEGSPPEIAVRSMPFLGPLEPSTMSRVSHCVSKRCQAVFFL
jgi:hypothetical protein